MLENNERDILYLQQSLRDTEKGYGRETSA